MSVFIKDMDMPKECELCIFCDCNAYCVCKFIGDVDESVDNGMRDLRCPLVEVPTPHGRLIDADRLLWEEGQGMVIQDASYGRGRERVKNAIRNAPTVIKGER